MKMPTTKEQIEINRSYIKKELDRIHHVASKAQLYAAVLFHWAPLSGCLETVVAYFEDYTEGKWWLEDKENTYKRLGVEYTTYIL